MHNAVTLSLQFSPYILVDQLIGLVMTLHKYQVSNKLADTGLMCVKY